MRKFLKTCRECWIVTLLMVILIAANGAHMISKVEHGDLSLPPILSILNIF